MITIHQLNYYNMYLAESMETVFNLQFKKEFFTRSGLAIRLTCAPMPCDVADKICAPSAKYPAILFGSQYSIRNQYRNTFTHFSEKHSFKRILSKTYFTTSICKQHASLSVVFQRLGFGLEFSALFAIVPWGFTTADRACRINILLNCGERVWNIC